MAYRIGSGWSDKMELECYLIMRKCEEQGMIAAELCRDLERRYGKPPYSSLHAKVGNYKTLANLIGDSSYSNNAERIYAEYKNSSIEDIQAALDKMR